VELRYRAGNLFARKWFRLKTATITNSYGVPRGVARAKCGGGAGSGRHARRQIESKIMRAAAAGNARDFFR
jgi:hypothetical protein